MKDKTFLRLADCGLYAFLNRPSDCRLPICRGKGKQEIQPGEVLKQGF